MNTFEIANTHSASISVSQMISEAAYKLVLLVERMIQPR